MKLEVVEGGREAWLEHRYTQRQLQLSKLAREKYMKLLLNVCRNSQDPEVLRVFNLWAAQDTLVRFLGGESEADVGAKKKEAENGNRTGE